METKYEANGTLLPFNTYLTAIGLLALIVNVAFFVPAQLLYVTVLSIIVFLLYSWRALLNFPLRSAESYTLTESSLVMEGKGKRTEIPYANMVDALYIGNFGLTQWAERGVVLTPYYYRHYTPGGFEPYGLFLRRRGGAGIPNKDNIIVVTNLRMAPGGVAPAGFGQLPSLWYLAPKEHKKFLEDLKARLAGVPNRPAYTDVEKLA